MIRGIMTQSTSVIHLRRLSKFGKIWTAHGWKTDSIVGGVSLLIQVFVHFHASRLRLMNRLIILHDGHGHFLRDVV
jgi:hypothetical protein